MSYSPLATGYYPAHPSNYTAGRQGTPIRKITIHHMAGVMSAQQCGGIFQREGRNGSSHYGIGNDGEIACYVNEEDIAWTNSNWPSNCESITIETSNCETGGEWPVSDAAYNSLIKLVADIAKRRGLGKLTAGGNLTWHSMIASTACPGDYLRDRIGEIADKANKINYPEIEWKPMNRPREMQIVAGGKLVKIKTNETVAKYDEPANVFMVERGYYNGITYYRSQYSHDKGVANGFKEKYVTEVPVEPEPVPTPEPTPVEPEPTPQPKKSLWQIIIEFIIKIFTIKKGKK